MGSRERWELYIVTGGVMVGIPTFVFIKDIPSRYADSRK
jgi:hypothetical protein